MKKRKNLIRIFLDMNKKINHNNLLPWFTQDHGQLPDAYLRKCRKFFNSIQHMLITKKDAAFLFKHRAASNKRQAIATIGKYNKK